jgi:hypothetical protein
VTVRSTISSRFGEAAPCFTGPCSRTSTGAALHTALPSRSDDPHHAHHPAAHPGSAAVALTIDQRACLLPAFRRLRRLPDRRGIWLQLVVAQVLGPEGRTLESEERTSLEEAIDDHLGEVVVVQDVGVRAGNGLRVVAKRGAHSGRWDVAAPIARSDAAPSLARTLSAALGNTSRCSPSVLSMGSWWTLPESKTEGKIKGGSHGEVIGAIRLGKMWIHRTPARSLVMRKRVTLQRIDGRHGGTGPKLSEFLVSPAAGDRCGRGQAARRAGRRDLSAAGWHV